MTPGKSPVDGRNALPKLLFWGHFWADLWVLFKRAYLRATRRVEPEVGLWVGIECLLPQGVPKPMSCLTLLVVWTYAVVVHTFACVFAQWQRF